jgi:hypothetical protein
MLQDAPAPVAGGVLSSSAAVTAQAVPGRGPAVQDVCVPTVRCWQVISGQLLLSAICSAVKQQPHAAGGGSISGSQPATSRSGSAGSRRRSSNGRRGSRDSNSKGRQCEHSADDLSVSAWLRVLERTGGTTAAWLSCGLDAVAGMQAGHALFCERFGCSSNRRALW